MVYVVKVVNEGNDEKMEAWLRGIAENSRPTYERYWNSFRDFLGLSTEQILAEKGKRPNGEWKQKLLAFRQWLLEEKGLSENSAKTACGVVRGFFSAHETPIYLSRGEKMRLAKAGRSTKDYKFSKPDMAKMLMVADLKERYIIAVGKSVGLRANDFLKFTYGDFRSVDLENEAPIYLGEYNTQKRGIVAHPFLDLDSTPIVKAMLEANQHKKDSDKVLTINASELSIILQRVSTKANIQHGNARIRFHAMRGWLITRLSASMAESQWKQIVGKTISEEAYVSTELLREAYKNCLKDLTVMNGNGNGVTALHEVIKQQETEIGTLKKRLEVLQQSLAKTDNTLSLLVSEIHTLFPILGKGEKTEKEER